MTRAIKVFGIVMRPEGFSDHSGLWPAVMATGMVPVEFGHRCRRPRPRRRLPRPLPEEAGTVAMDTPLVSVIVGVCNKERFVGECLRSVLSQTYANWELIVVGDASTDRSVAEVERTVGGDSRARILRQKDNSGHPGVARNQALWETKGKYVAFLDADDRWKRGKLEAQVGYMEEHPGYPLTHTACEEIDESGQVLHVRHNGTLPPLGDCWSALFKHCFICTSTVMVRRDFGERLEWFLEKPVYRCGENYDLFLRSVRMAEIGLVEGIWGEYRRLDSSISHGDDNWENTPADDSKALFFFKRGDLWKDRVPVAEMRENAWWAARRNCQHWRTRGLWRRAGGLRFMDCGGGRLRWRRGGKSEECCWGGCEKR